MANLGRPAEIALWPLHYFIAVRLEYLRAAGLVRPAKKPDRLDEIAPGVTVETYGSDG